MPEKPATTPPAAELAAGHTSTSAAAARDWQRLATTLPLADRITLVADTVWGRAYPLAYRHTYIGLARRIKHVARTVGAMLDDRSDPAGRARKALTHLADVALTTQAGPPPAGVPPAHQRTVDAAALAAIHRPDGEPAWRAVSRTVWSDGLKYGALHGVLHAAADIDTTWREITGYRDLSARLGGGDVVDWLNATLAGANWEVAAPWLRAAPQQPDMATAAAQASFAAPARAAIEAPPAVPIPKPGHHGQDRRTEHPMNIHRGGCSAGRRPPARTRGPGGLPARIGIAVGARSRRRRRA